MNLFGKKNPRKKLLHEARSMSAMAQKIINYRKDLLSEEAIAQLGTHRDRLAELSHKKSEATGEQLDAAIDEADKTFKKFGGDIYPVTFWNENIEMLLVAAIVAIAIRTFFFQPFKIPTNSMWPTYAGMKPTVYSVANGESRPMLPVRLINKVTSWATNYRAHAPVDGTIFFDAVIGEDERGVRSAKLPPKPAKGSMFGLGVIQSPKAAYPLIIGSAGSGVEVDIKVPAEFQIEEVILKSYFPEFDSLYKAIETYAQQGKVERLGGNLYRIMTNVTVERGDTVIDFDIKTGDMLFVDRFSYHFFPPEIGDPIVFRTDEIPGLRTTVQGGFIPDESYYIKRLVGIPGDTLRIDDHVLKRNGEPITGSDAFDRNHQLDGEYEGYAGIQALGEGRTLTIAEGHFFAMGDNSDESHDGRGWGWSNAGYLTPEEREQNVPLNQVPERAVVGKAMFIFYPLSTRWGPAD